MESPKKRQPSIENGKSFFSSFFEETEKKIEFEEQQKKMIEKLEQYNKKFGKGQAPPISILKQKPEESKKPVNLPAHKSMARRAPELEDIPGFGAPKQQVMVEEKKE